MGLREEKKRGTRNRLLKEAGELFAAKGYQNVTTSEIARSSGIAEGTLFNYFKTKGDLFVASIIPPPSDGLHRRGVLEDISPSGLTEAVVNMLDRELSPLADVGKEILLDYFTVVYGGGLSDREAARSGLFSADERIVNQIHDLFVTQIQAYPSKLSSLNVELALECVFGCVTSLLSRYVLTEEMDYDQLRQAMRDQILFILTGHVTE